MNSLQGHLLVAAPSFVGSPLPRAVVLVTEHTEEAATGVVLNHPLNEQILRSCLEMWQAGKTPAIALKMIQPHIPGLVIGDGDAPEVADFKIELEDHCQQESHCHERKRDPHEEESTTDAAVNSSAEIVGAGESAAEAGQTLQIPVGVLMAPNSLVGGRLKEKSPPLFRVVVGQVGWRSSDLETELAHGHWMTTPATPDLLFAAHDDLWKLAVNRVGEQALHAGFGITPMVPTVLN